MHLFEGIIPCGIQDKAVISLAQLLDEPPSLEAVAERVCVHFADVFGCTLHPGAPARLASAALPEQ
jgi:lipoate-protein ligase B